MSPFEEYPGASFSEADVENYLEELAAKGWKVFKHHNDYIVVIDDDRRITVRFSSYRKDWSIEPSDIDEKLPPSLNPAVNFQQFKGCFVEAAEYLGVILDSGPDNIRLHDVTPVSNKYSLASMTLKNPVKCIFDPYFDDKAIANLNTLVNIGMSLEKDVRVLTTSKVQDRLSKQLIKDFKTEKDVNLEIRCCASDKEHRRYLLLSAGDSLIIGFSLNSLDKNETARIENSQEDRDFFEAQWKTSLPF